MSEGTQLREARLDEIRREAELTGRVDLTGVRPAGSPMPMASPQTGYYEQPLLKEPQWTPLIPLYFFVGGATGALGVIGSLADLLGAEEALALKARWMALAGAGISASLLIVDLGRPSRFLNMLRVFKPQSPMSVGAFGIRCFGRPVEHGGLCRSANGRLRLRIRLTDTGANWQRDFWHAAAQLHRRADWLNRHSGLEQSHPIPPSGIRNVWPAIRSLPAGSQWAQ
jgi:hypothetical protein